MGSRDMGQLFVDTRLEQTKSSFSHCGIVLRNKIDISKFKCDLKKLSKVYLHIFVSLYNIHNTFTSTNINDIQRMEYP
jgi:hypothetical protein